MVEIKLLYIKIYRLKSKNILKYTKKLDTKRVELNFDLIQNQHSS